jgi:hypothetical protein
MGKYGDCYACIKCRLAMMKERVDTWEIPLQKKTKIRRFFRSSAKRRTFGMINSMDSRKGREWWRVWIPNQVGDDILLLSFRTSHFVIPAKAGIQESFLFYTNKRKKTLDPQSSWGWHWSGIRGWQVTFNFW